MSQAPSEVPSDSSHGGASSFGGVIRGIMSAVFGKPGATALGWSREANESLARGRLRRLKRPMSGEVGGIAGMLLKLGPWKVTLLSAMLCGMCFPPVGLGPLMLFAMAPFLVMLPRFKSLAGALVASFLFGWIYLLIPLYWLIAMTPLTMADPPIGAMVVMWMLSCGIQMLWMLLIGFVGHVVGKQAPKTTYLLLLPLLFAGIEAARLALPFPGPLIHAAEALHVIDVLIQAADLGGIYLVSAFVVLVNGCMALVLDRQMRRRKDGKKLAGVVMFAAFGAMVAYGGFRMATLGNQVRADGPLVVTIQPNIGQEQKNREYSGQGDKSPNTSAAEALDQDSPYDGIPEQLARVTTMTIDAASKYPDADLIVWPETAMPGYMPAGYGIPVKQLDDADWALTDREKGEARFVIQQYEPGRLIRNRIGKPLLYGVEIMPSQSELAKYPYLTPADLERQPKYNSAVLLDAMGQPQGRHDKVKLVPAGEYIPYRGTVLGDFATHYMRELAGYVPRLIPGDESILDKRRFRVASHVGDGREWEFTTNICFEYAFSDLYVGLHRNAPVDFAVTLSNEAWYGHHSELDQAVIQTKFRAIESRASFVRCTNSGVTCVVDPLGRVVSKLTTGVEKRDRLFSGIYAQNVPVFDKPRASLWQSTIGSTAIPALQAIAILTGAIMVLSLATTITTGIGARKRRKVRRAARKVQTQP